MAIQIVMDRTGDSRHPFNSHDAQELAKAEQRFYQPRIYILGNNLSVDLSSRLSPLSELRRPTSSPVGL
jgi:hypothetical protein